MTVKDYCEVLEWTTTDLSREARISYQSAYKAWYQQPVITRIKRDICSAFSEALGREVKLGDVEWTNGST